MTTMIVHRGPEQSVQKSNTDMESGECSLGKPGNTKWKGRFLGRECFHCWKMRTCQSVTESPGFQNALGSSHTRCCSSGLSIILES